MKNMEGMKAKRDARRKRILENSEKRLLKITGLNGDTKLEDTSSQTSFIYRNMQEDTLQPDINGTISDDRIKNADILESDDIRNGILTSPKDKCNDIRTEAKNVHNTLARMKLLPPILLINRTYYMLLAFILNILLVLELDYLFGETIVMPCLLMMLGRLYGCTNTRETEGGSLLCTALILCNIKPEVTYRVKKFVTLLHLVVEDLAVYIFSFSLMHYAFFHCLRKIDILEY
ncbi:PREDICTED: uncharacterized protein LOC107186081 [Dufourea novaeangliae]|uniref:Calcium signal-modulating cyclophilin ligand n=1 Tax=Dufourea novaeangliae TaxID=178035 RepID=A0A154P7K2_DUFNO|nr:PREDICTED: uncharacterized protein LOC107186081 [Dufourea novaeangliae]KZC07842.1 hypothetical protein WN55_09924 [Dufourea novaeangliae]